MLKIVFEKQSAKYLAKVDSNTYNKLIKAINGLKDLNGDIKAMKGIKDTYRLKIYGYRIIFEYIRGEFVIRIITIAPRGDVYKKGGK